MTSSRCVNTVDEFVAILVRSGLLAEAEVSRRLDEYRRTYLATQQLPDGVTAFCSFLVTSGLLTPWQCERLRHGQWRGFVFEGYTLLDWLGCDEDHSFYLGRSPNTGVVVRLVISPPQPGPRPDSSPHHDFSVEPFDS